MWSTMQWLFMFWYIGLCHVVPQTYWNKLFFQRKLDKFTPLPCISWLFLFQHIARLTLEDKREGGCRSHYKGHKWHQPSHEGLPTMQVKKNFGHFIFNGGFGKLIINFEEDCDPIFSSFLLRWKITWFCFI